MSDPIDHHYLARFYLSRWLGRDGLICRFSRPYAAEVKAKRVALKGTAYEPLLYRGIEKEFMKRLDTEAAEALALLERGLPDGQWTDASRSAWSRFVNAQRLRSPEDIIQLVSSVGEEWANVIPGLEAKALVPESSEADRLEVRQYLKHYAEAHAFEIAQRLMDHPGIGQVLNDMRWLVLDVGPDLPLLTSDRPVWATGTLTGDDGSLLMPIGPRKLFTATRSSAVQRNLAGRSGRQLARQVNELTVAHAVKYVYGLSDGALGFVQKLMGKRRHSTLLEQVAAAQGHKITAPDSPLAKE